MTRDEKINEIMSAATRPGLLDSLPDTMINAIYQKVTEQIKNARLQELRETITKATEELTILEKK
mgnify:CR=1 FL=1